MTGCKNESVPMENAYNITNTVYSKGIEKYSFFSDEYCVSKNKNTDTDKVISTVAEGAGVFNINTKKVCYQKNIYEKLYPASTTKILTAYIILTENKMDEMVTISSNAASQGYDSSACGIKEGDQISVKELLHGLLLVSGNDAAVALAEHNSGNVEKFTEKMNNVALSLGATDSHFVNSSGYPNEDHYTTIYDMYMIFSKAIQINEFCELIKTSSYDAHYKDIKGNEVTQKWNNTCNYTTGINQMPEGYSVIGGKTGTSASAGFCMVLLSENSKKEKVISIVYKASTRENMYKLMGEILTYSSK